jgi:oligosaccharide reducing-end xylanase
MKEGKLKGYFAWSCKLSGEKNAWGPAPDGEEYFAMALFTAASRWGDGEGIYEYSREARELLHTCLHHEAPMWNAANKQILFVPAADFTDPSYHLPHFYEVFAEKAEEADRSFWKEAAAASRSLIAKSCHPVTGLAPEYSAFDGSPHPVKWSDNEEHGGDFYSDAYRVAYNIGLDALWCGPSKPLSEAAARLQAFFADVDPSDYCRYSLDGGRLASSYLHPVGLIATTAAATPATLGVGGLGEAADRNAEKLVRLFWDTPPRKGVRRYYDNCLYHFAALLLSGRYQPDAAAS